jgi:hypothetical protein
VTISTTHTKRFSRSLHSSVAAPIAIRISATRSHWKRLSAASSAMPMPPAPTSPRTADSRTLMSQRNSAIDQNAGFTCGQ